MSYRHLQDYSNTDIIRFSMMQEVEYKMICKSFEPMFNWKKDKSKTSNVSNGSTNSKNPGAGSVQDMINIVLHQLYS